VSRYALIGDPVEHSPSPAMLTAAFRAAGLPHTYEAIRVGADELDGAWPRLRDELAGMNVTTPLKERVAARADELSPAARASGSVNTVVFTGGRALGASTDGAGFLAALDHAAARTGGGMGPAVAPGGGEPARAGSSVPPMGEEPSRAVVLGAGGAARAVASALRGRGMRVAVAARRAEASRKLAEELGVETIAFDPGGLADALADASLVVNATPASGADASPVPDTVPLRPGLVVFDLVYRPRRTALLVRAEREGCVTIEGVEMLVEQGARSFELWTGTAAPVDEMRAAALEALAGTGSR